MPREARDIDVLADQDEWASQGQCRDENPLLFDTYVKQHATVIDADVETAMDICADCPVMMRCLEHAIRFNVKHGVWGGMVPEQRTAWAEKHHPEWLPKRHLELVAA